MGQLYRRGWIHILPRQGVGGEAVGGCAALTAWTCRVKGWESAALSIPSSLSKIEKVTGKSTSGEEN